MGNFYGGSTIIRRGKFTSYDPADDSDKRMPRKKRNRKGSVKAARTQAKAPVDPVVKGEKARKALLHSIIDQRFLSKDEIKLPRNLLPSLMHDVTRAGSPVAWAEAQPAYHSEFQARYRKLAKKKSSKSKKASRQTDTALRTVEIPQEDSSRFSEEEVLRRGKDRVKTHGSKRRADELNAFFLKVGKLPPSPRLVGSKKRLSNARKKWEAFMDTAQKKAWNNLRPNQQMDYLVTGIVKLGNRMPPASPNKSVKPLCDAPVSYITKKFEDLEKEEWDTRKIDWDST